MEVVCVFQKNSSLVFCRSCFCLFVCLFVCFVFFEEFFTGINRFGGGSY